MKRISFSVLFLWFTSFSASAATVALNGVLNIAGGVNIYNPDTDTYAYQSGSYFAMGANNPDTAVMLQPGAAGGVILGSYQPYVLSPDEPHPAGHPDAPFGAGSGYTTPPTTESNIVLPFSFFSSQTYIGTNPVAYQSGDAHPAPSATVDTDNCIGTVCTLTADFSSWEVMWNGTSFEQGPRPDNTGPFTLATGTLDVATNLYTLYWASQIKGGSFNGVTGHWYLEGTLTPVPLPAPLLLFLSGLISLLFVRQRKI